MRPLADALREALAALGLGHGMARAAAVAAWQDAARACIGDDAQRTKALRVEERTLVVAVPSPVLAQELRLRSHDLLRELGRRAPEANVAAVRFVPG